MAQRVYISGGISDLPHPVYRRRFLRAEELLRSKGWEVVNPTKLDPIGECACHSLGCNPGEHRWSCYMKRDIHELTTCHAIYMLEGWQDSHGARLEHQVGAACGLKLMYEEHF